MADKRITELSDYASPISTDVMPIVDVTAGLTKKITIAQLVANAISVKTGVADVYFGGVTQEDSNAVFTVYDSRVTAASIIHVTPSGVATTEHDPDDVACEVISGYATNIVDATSFDIVGVAPNGTFGNYTFNYSFN